MGDFTDPTKERITNAIPIAVSMFCAEYQWEFLDAYATTTAALDATSGKYKITLPTSPELFKPVAFWTNTHGPLEYVDRKSWGEIQANVSPTLVAPLQYTVIGTNYFLDRPATGETIYCVYTRNSDGVDFNQIPGQYQPAIAHAVNMWLTPARMDNGFPNPAFDAAQVRYLREVDKGTGMEMSIKGRPRHFARTELAQMRSEYR